MDDESVEFMERSELTCVARSKSKMERPAQGCQRELSERSRELILETR